MHGKFWLLSREKASSHSTVLPRCFFHCVQCFRVSIWPALRRTLLRLMDMGSLTCAQIWVRVIHTNAKWREGGGGSGTNKSAQELTRRDRKTVCHPAPPGDRTQGLLIWIPTHYKHWATSPVYRWGQQQQQQQQQTQAGMARGNRH